MLVVSWILPVPARAAGKAAAKITYDDHVMPILREKCFGCHNQDRKSGGLRLNTYANVMMGSASGEVVKPGDADGSVLLKVISHQQEPYMPPKSDMLPKASIDVIHAWIAAGALENSGSKAKMAAAGPKMEMSLSSVLKGKPDGPPPMPGLLSLEPVVAATPKGNAVTALAASPWAPLAAVAGERQVALYNTDTLDYLGVLPFPEGMPRVLHFSRNGGLLLAGGGIGGKSGRVVVWDVKSGKRVFEGGEEYDSVLAADISPDQSEIALGGPSKVVRVYSTRDGKLLHEIKKHTDWIYSLEYSPDGVLLASGDRSGGLYVWEAHTAREYFTLRGHTAGITSVSWRPDSNVLASGSEDGSVRLWEMENGNQIKTWGAHGGVESIQYARDGRIATCGRDHTVRVWNQNGGQERVFEAFGDVAMRVAFAHDGARVLGGDWTGDIRVWIGADGKRLGNLLANPPTLAGQLENAGKQLAALKAESERLTGIAAASEKAAAAAAADLAAVQKSADDLAAAARARAAEVEKAKEAVKQNAAALQAAQEKVHAQDILAKAYAEADLKVAGMASREKDHKELATAAARSRQLIAHVNGELVAAQKSVTDLTAAGKQAREHVPAAEKAAQQAAAQAAAAQKTIPAKATPSKKAAEKAAADRDAASRATAAWRAQVDRWTKALAQARQPAPPDAKAKK
jgi:hypothetical protein